MYEVLFYEDQNGYSQLIEFIDDLNTKASTEKTSRIELKQILFYIELLKLSGTRAGENITKHIDGDIWELRPGNNRIFYFAWRGNRFVLLHQFKKKTNKTPQREIEQAKREYEDWNRRNQGGF
jgi:phage-related protein